MPSTRVAGIGRRFDPEQLAGSRAGLATVLATVLARALSRFPAERRAQLCGQDPTIDMDSSEVEVYGGRRKKGVAYNYRTANGCAANCSASPPASSATPAASNYA